MSWPQLTNSIIFQRGRLKPPTSYCWVFHYVFQLTNFWDLPTRFFGRRTSLAIFAANGFGGESRGQWHLGAAKNEIYHNWLVVWNMNFIFPNSSDDDPIWRTHILQRGRYTTNQIMMIMMYLVGSSGIFFWGLFFWVVRGLFWMNLTWPAGGFVATTKQGPKSWWLIISFLMFPHFSWHLGVYTSFRPHMYQICLTGYKRVFMEFKRWVRGSLTHGIDGSELGQLALQQWW